MLLIVPPDPLTIFQHTDAVLDATRCPLGCTMRCLIAAVKIVGCSGVGHRPDRDTSRTLSFDSCPPAEHPPRFSLP